LSQKTPYTFSRRPTALSSHLTKKDKNTTFSADQPAFSFEGVMSAMQMILKTRPPQSVVFKSAIVDSSQMQIPRLPWKLAITLIHKAAVGTQSLGSGQSAN
jgi:hypothetical protein